ncbi:MAG: hypothetical protein J7K61_02165 [Thermoplasmata archaeon]|nr:hypothetical protein [Thermoplasmata archaeon]
MNEGFILSNKIRLAIFTEIASGEKRIDRIAKKNHIIEKAAMQAAEELKQHGLIEEKEEGYELTEEGRKIYAKMKGSQEI